MALSLSAEQKELLKIFKIEEQYVIPSYQRPYSWEYDQCFQLYNDVVAAFESRQDYFIGNIIIAKSTANKEYLEVVDGQQRLITTLLIFKVLSLFQPEFKVLEQLLEKEDWEGVNKVLRVRSDVFEANDEDALSSVLKFDLAGIQTRFEAVVDKSNKIIERLCNSRFEANILYFFNWIKFFRDNGGDLRELTHFLLKQVYLLPIELSGPTQDEANEKALVIFETINNRGMNLEDADIFKAKLYNKAKSVKEAEIFMELWTDFKNNCESLQLNIDDIFRYYSHIIRGKQGITSSETNLREFFTNERFSPFELKKYREVLADLFKIIEILELINQEKVRSTATAQWLQIIDAYTNQYPKYAIVNYLYVHDLALDEGFIRFLTSLTRYIYFQGSTSTVKFEIYNIIKQTSAEQAISSYSRTETEPAYFNYLGRLKKGFALLAFYLGRNEALPSYNIDKIINLKDERFLPEDWRGVNLDNIIDSLGNFVVLDMPKKNIPFTKKAEYYSRSGISEVNHLLQNGTISFNEFQHRDLSLKETLAHFFQALDHE